MPWAIFDLGPGLVQKKPYVKVLFNSCEEAEATLNDLLGTYKKDSAWHKRLIVIEAYIASVNTGESIEFNGERHPVKEWGRRLGISPYVISWRLWNGWTVERALTQQVKRRAA